MAGNYKGGPGGGRFKKPAKIGRGTLEAVRSDGPHNEWLGMPPYYIHYMMVDGVEYNYLSADSDLGFDLGKTVTFRYKETKKGNMIEKRSLGLVIDPSELN